MTRYTEEDAVRAIKDIYIRTCTPVFPADLAERLSCSIAVARRLLNDCAGRVEFRWENRDVPVFSTNYPDQQICTRTYQGLVVTEETLCTMIRELRHRIVAADID
jgi:hypothetical protein